MKACFGPVVAVGGVDEAFALLEVCVFRLVRVATVGWWWEFGRGLTSCDVVGLSDWCWDGSGGCEEMGC